MQSQLKRTRKLRLPVAATTAHIQPMINELNNNDAVSSVIIDGTTLTIHYNFPGIVFGSVWQIINRHLDLATFGTYTRCKYAVIVWMEDNERDHLCAHSGWNRYIQDIYVGHAGEDHLLSRQIRSQKNQRIAISHRKAN